MSNNFDEYGRSLDLAAHINAMKPIIMDIDLEWLEIMITRFQEQASFEESAAVLNPNYNPEKPPTLKVMAITMSHLLNFIEGLKECDRLKLNVAAYEKQRDEISKLFT